MEPRFNRSNLGNLSTFYANKGAKETKKGEKRPQLEAKKNYTFSHSTWPGLFLCSPRVVVAAAVVVIVTCDLWFPAAFYLSENRALIWYGTVHFFRISTATMAVFTFGGVHLKFMHIHGVAHNEGDTVLLSLFFVI